MPFDLASAKPVKSKFDLSTAKPVIAEEAQTAPPEDPSLWDKYKNSVWGKIGPLSVIEPAAKLATNIVGAPLAGLAGIATSGTNAIGLTNTPAADVTNAVAGTIEHQPITPGGKLGDAVVSYPFEKLQQGADWVGDQLNNPAITIPTPYGNIQGGAGPATVANTAIQFLPSLLLKGRGGRVAEREIPHETAANGAAAGAKVSPAESVARDYVASNTSLGWDAIPGAIKAKLVEIVNQSGDLSGLDPKALERQAQLGSLRVPVPATRGILERDPVQLRNEGNVSATTAGKPIRDVHLAANNALLQNLEILKGRTKGSATTPEQVGRSVQEAARGKADASKANYDALYKKARETEPDAAVNAAPLKNMLEHNPEVQHLGFMQSWFSKAKSAGPTKQVPLSELQDLREKASGISRAGGTDGYYAGQVVRSIDEAMTQVPEAAKAWKAAQQAFKKHKTEFEEQGGVAKLVEDKSRTDRATALEDTWRKTVIGGSIEDLRKVKRSLLTGGDQATRGAGKQAWRDMRAQTIQHITDEATKSVTRFEDGSPNITPASMERAIRSIGKDKLDEIFGPGTVREINKIMEATRLVKTEPPAIHKGASTASNVLALLSSKLDKIPVLGSPVAGAIKMVGSLKDIGENDRVVRRAQSTQLDEVKPAPPSTTRQKIAAAMAAQQGRR